jgi:hypothetical protein
MGLASQTGFESIAPVSANYAALPVRDAYTWAECAPRVGPGSWYLVAFRSILRESADEARLWEYDHRAYDEASRSPGFVHYVRGLPTARRECLSFCLWKSRDQAREASRLPAHLEAIGLVQEMYERYVLEFLRVGKRSRATGFEFEQFDRA